MVVSVCTLRGGIDECLDRNRQFSAAATISTNHKCSAFKQLSKDIIQSGNASQHATSLRSGIHRCAPSPIKYGTTCHSVSESLVPHLAPPRLHYQQPWVHRKGDGGHIFSSRSAVSHSWDRRRLLSSWAGLGRPIFKR